MFQGTKVSGKYQEMSCLTKMVLLISDLNFSPHGINETIYLFPEHFQLIIHDALAFVSTTMLVLIK
jgi:hypothetical protein